MAPPKTNEWAARHMNVLLSAVYRRAPFQQNPRFAASVLNIASTPRQLG